ncbi:ABC transporter ATP-binding protein [Actinospica durhamensis]|uniref:ABC transporter ATP-binding protein n=1 Tax=Actinospica durhamensis TaxID=1508375 RepID=A0A941IRK7_9ACTN|nr:ABC transporter ATP-binding protein [Actinospica durhamensis]MBR7838905.1 ABC transporter ATP-binding protein [Actinospica durhamensis]
MTAILEARMLGMTYGRRRALTECSVTIPPGRMVGLVGPNGAGKSTLLKLACGVLTPTSGSISVLGRTPGTGPEQLARVGFLAQDAPVYANLSVGDHLRLGARLNPGWGQGFVERRIAALELDPRQKAGKLSGGQRAQLALAVAAGKRPELLILDEPVASLDPLARRAFLEHLTQSATENGTRVILSSHLISDLERFCDYLIVLVASRVRLAGNVDQIIAAHHRIVCTRRDPGALPAGLEVVSAEHAEHQSTFVVRSDGPLPPGDWVTQPLSMEDLVLAYMGTAESGIRSATQGDGGAR